MINHVMRKDLEYIYKDNNLNRHWRKLDIEERRFIDDLIEYFDRRLMFIDDRMNENIPIIMSDVRYINKEIDLSDQYAKWGES
tara:strand:+ start:95 stop:343 length:249 start_codon:yes stop_codon:yes gene_type:complete